jgi:hypothetical protein
MMEEGNEKNKTTIEVNLESFYDELYAKELKLYSIIDKKSLLGKMSEPNEQFQTLAIDIMMYTKYKIKNGLSIEGLIELLRKLKTCLLKMIASQEFMRTLAISKQSAQGHIQE